MAKRIEVRALWDDEAGVFVATSDDVPGLVAEAENSEVLDRKLKILIPELLELNGFPASWGEFEEVSVVVKSERTSLVRVHA